MNSTQIVETLKKDLKKRGVTYHALAARLGQSEANVKRFFSEGNFTLKRLD